MDAENTDALDRADMEQLVGGHDQALNRLMERHARSIFHFLYRMLGSEDDANDCAQEAFVRVYRARGSYRPEQSFRTWLFTIAGNLARNQLRWRSRHPSLSLEAASESTEQSLADTLPAEAPAPHQVVEAAERQAAVRAAVARLPDELREAVVLCEWEELSQAEAATVLKVTPKAVESRLYRARQLLRQRLPRWL
jgi:RNA polymerase sigma-70 factor, ECF subfamily